MVRRFGEADTAQLYEAREVVEAHAVRIGFAKGRITSAFLAGLEAEQSALMAAVNGKTGPQLAAGLAFDRAFHARIAGLCGNALLTELHAKIITQTHTVRAYAHAPHLAERLREEHGAILEAFRSGHPSPVLRALKRHLDRSRRDLLGCVMDPAP
ncbi:MAG TPA: FCD domain-containing protein, partial [Acetobacteraceae bacterium]|nr:FCD domain-containing protein [Acetobacteraceae bacterium]